MNGVFIREQAAALSELHNVWVLHIEVLPRGEKRGPRHKIKHDRGFMEELIEVRNRPFIWQFSYLLSMARALRRLKKVFKPELVHAHIAVPATWGAVLLRRILKVPIVVTENSSEFGSWLKRPGLRWMAWQAFSRVDLVIAVSEGQRKRIETTFNRNTGLVIVPNIVNTSRFTPTNLPEVSHQSGYSLLFIGLMDTTQKGVHILLEALTSIKEEGKLPFPLHVNLVGDGVLKEEYRQQAKRLGIEEMVTFQGLLSHEGIEHVMRQCHALVLPSLHEALPLVIIEAMASGRPVIATRCGGPEYMVDENTGVIVEPGEPAPLAEAIANVVMHLDRYDPQKIAAIAENRYSYRSVTSELTKIYKELTARS